VRAVLDALTDAARAWQREHDLGSGDGGNLAATASGR
jgi:hypothetical protein